MVKKLKKCEDNSLEEIINFKFIFTEKTMLNKVMLIGNLGADPEVRYMPSGDTITTINLATSRRWKDRQTGDQREETEWHRVTFFNIGNFKIAEIAAEYLKKGSKVYVEGRIKTSKYQKNGQDHYSTAIIADQMQMLDSRAGGTGDFSQQGGSVAPQTNQNQNFQQQPQQVNQQQPQQQSQPQNFQQPQQVNHPAPQQNYQQTQQFTPPTQQVPLQPPPVQQEQQPVQSFNQSPPVQQSQPEKTTTNSVKDDYNDDIPF